MNNIIFNKVNSEAYNWFMNNLNRLSDEDFKKVQEILTRLYNADSRISMIKSLEYTLFSSVDKTLGIMNREYEKLKDKYSK